MDKKSVRGSGDRPLGRGKRLDRKYAKRLRQAISRAVAPLVADMDRRAAEALAAAPSIAVSNAPPIRVRKGPTRRMAHRH